MKKGKLVLLIGLLIFIVVILINNGFGMPPRIVDFITGICIGIELAGAYMIIKEKGSK